MSEELKVEKIIEKMDLKILTPDIDVGSKVVMVPDINRPALQLAGFFEAYFLQIIAEGHTCIFCKDDADVGKTEIDVFTDLR